MNTLPPPLGTGGLSFWRIDDARFASGWDRGEGAFRVGGRWNSAGVRAVYASIDPATAILEVAVHKGFRVLDTVSHVLSSATILEPGEVHVVLPSDVPNPNWLVPGSHGTGQRAFGDALLRKYPFVLLPSTISRHSWNIVFDPLKASVGYGDIKQEAFALDPRLVAP